MPVQTRPRNPPRRERVMEVEMEENQYAGEGVVDTPRLNKLEFDENDEKIINATLKAFESGSLTPLIKEELRCTIQSRRLAEGKGEMTVEFKTPVRRKEMDDDEKRRALKRRQQNREAAQRFRQRQKDTSDYLSAKIKKLEKSADSLTDQMNRLKEEKELLGQMLRDHLSVCSNPQHITASNIFTPNTSTNDATVSVSSNNVLETTYPVPDFSSSNAQNVISQSSVDSTLTCEFTPNTAASDASSVFFPDNKSENNENYENYESYTPPPPPRPDTNTAFNRIPENNLTHQPITHFDNFDKLSMTDANSTVLQPLHNVSSDNNVIVYDGQLDACYEEIIIDFSDEAAEFLRNDGRVRGDSCSSVDTVSSMYNSSTTGSELTPIKETPADVVVPQFNAHDTSYNSSVNATTLSTYSGINNIIDVAASFNNSVPCGKTLNFTDDLFLIDNEAI